MRDVCRLGLIEQKKTSNTRKKKKIVDTEGVWLLETHTQTDRNKGERRHKRGLVLITHLLSIIEDDGSSAFDHSENHDGAEFPPH